MGNWLASRSRSGQDTPSERPSKRTRESGDEEVEELSPKRKRIQSTSSYIYETLYRKGVNHDVTIFALGKEWKMHKICLCQSRYFSSMFSGNWKESTLSEIVLDIPDPNITAEALDLAFGSLYRDAVLLTSSQVLPTIATATMLHMEGLLEHCKEFIRDTKNGDCIVPYLTAASVYGLQDIQQECRDWLDKRLMTHYTVTLLRDLSIGFFASLLGSQDLYVMQVEMDVYSLAKKWLFLALNPEWNGDINDLLSEADNYFQKRDTSAPFLETEAGAPYVPVFRAVRYRHILNDHSSVGNVEGDRIVPTSWLMPLYRKQWLKMLTVDHRLDTGPTGLTQEQFDRSSIRCGRVLNDRTEYCWRWTGFSFGVDVLICFESDLTVSVKRNTRYQPCVSAVSLQLKRAIAIRLRVTSFNEEGDVLTHQDTGIVHLSLQQDEEKKLLAVDSKMRLPLYVSANLALFSFDHDT